MGLIEFVFRPRGKQLPLGKYDCELASSFTPEGPDEGPAYFKVLAFREPEEEDAHFIFELTPETSFWVDGFQTNRSAAMAALDDNPHFIVVAADPGRASEFHIDRSGRHA